VETGVMEAVVGKVVVVRTGRIFLKDGRWR
jgi:hypothetical protein